MAKTLDDSVIDGSLNIVKNGATQLCICNAQPLNYAEATTTADGGANKYCLGKKTGLSASNFTGPVDGTPNGRKLTVNAQTGITVDYSGTALFAALCSGTVLLAVTSVTSQVLTAGNTMNTPAFIWQISDPT